MGKAEHPQSLLESYNTLKSLTELAKALDQTSPQAQAHLQDTQWDIPQASHL